MSTDVISSSLGVSYQVAELFTQQLDAYCSFKTVSIQGFAQVSGSTTHDNIGTQLVSALKTWQSLISSDSQEIKNAGATFADKDFLLARGLLGLCGQ